MKPERKGGYGLVLAVTTTSIGGKALTVQYLNEDNPVTLLVGPALVERIDFQFEDLENHVTFIEYDQCIEGVTTYVDREGTVQTHRQTLKNAVITSQTFKPLDVDHPITIRLRIKEELNELKRATNLDQVDDKLLNEIREMKAMAGTNPSLLAKLESMERALLSGHAINVIQTNEPLY